MEVTRPTSRPVAANCGMRHPSDPDSNREVLPGQYYNEPRPDNTVTFPPQDFTIGGHIET